MKVNNYECGMSQQGEVWIQTESQHLEVNQGKVFLTQDELVYLLGLLAWDEESEIIPVDDPRRHVDQWEDNAY